MSDESSSSSPASPAPPSSHFIAKKDEIIRAGRVTKLVNGREVLVLHHDGVFHALDMRCYHSGGLLQYGDIEEFNGRLCIVCPWHKYKITLAEGENLYQAVDPKEKPPKPKWLSKGVKQRVHRAIEVEEDVFVRLNDAPGRIESDAYQTQHRAGKSQEKTTPKK
ncbi:hypothetical protein COCON_G00153910 [Conger conger]|uniref:Rieske domain-containing protein n=1 Tax=Conger conger TaxID=82655 RepID=A0A9Q1D9F5_CONCO|nr:Rieske domain-containing protein-like [Conger conger]XP_061115293.1 Rieske domain-containing protein-like [Conger conger]KAJ8262934.1 hypothetical protein COCON_G00153910 [Conger conger]